MSTIQLIQMSGRPGTGKSSLARGIAPHLRAIVVDYDVTKSALLDQGVKFEDAGHLAYETNYETARHILEQGWSVILDSPCRFPRILEAGQEIARASGATYQYLECVLKDDDELRRRIRGRQRRRSQVVDLGQPSSDATAPDAATLSDSDRTTSGQVEMVRPLDGAIAIDTGQSQSECVREALAVLLPSKTRYHFRYRRFGDFTYNILPEAEIKPFLLDWLRREWEIDHAESPDQQWTVEWLELLPQMEFRIETVPLESVRLRQDLMDYKTDSEDFAADLNERADEREESLLRGVSTEPIVLNGVGNELMDGYTRYTVMKRHNQEKVLAYVGRIRGV